MSYESVLNILLLLLQSAQVSPLVLLLGTQRVMLALDRAFLLVHVAAYAHREGRDVVHQRVLPDMHEHVLARAGTILVYHLLIYFVK